MSRTFYVKYAWQNAICRINWNLIVNSTRTATGKTNIPLSTQKCIPPYANGHALKAILSCPSRSLKDVSTCTPKPKCPEHKKLPIKCPSRPCPPCRCMQPFSFRKYKFFQSVVNCNFLH